MLALIALGLFAAQAPTIDERPQPIPAMHLPVIDPPVTGKLSVTFHLCPANESESPECQMRRREWARGKDEADLHELIRRDLQNQQLGQIDLSVRARITAICIRIEKNNY
jgi:hypothetical protein